MPVVGPNLKGAGVEVIESQTKRSRFSFRWPVLDGDDGLLQFFCRALASSSRYLSNTALAAAV